VPPSLEHKGRLGVVTVTAIIITTFKLHICLYKPICNFSM